ncbi:MAG: hypothetical protein E7172_04115 [Firmicutes bacterium]|nr:hypothetical protein [Bacillota bacterium]
MDFENIIKKFNYDQQLATFLENLYQELLIYYGEEKKSIIYETLLNTQIVSTKNCYNYLYSNGYIQDDENEEMYKVVTGTYFSEPKIEYDFDSKSFKIIDLSRIIVIKNLDLQHEYIKASLIHEIVHAIKSYNKGYEIVGDTLIRRVGLNESAIRLYLENNIVKGNDLFDLGIGLEEGTTSIAEEELMRKMFNENYRVSGYQVINQITKTLIEALSLEESIKNAQFYKNKDELSIDSEIFEKINKILDKIYELTLIMYENIFNLEKIDETTKLIEEILVTQFHPLLKELEEKRCRR